MANLSNVFAKYSRPLFLAALAFPILILAIETFIFTSDKSGGQQYTLKITGFDPRDLLSGHYLIYRIEYDVPGGACVTEHIAICMSSQPREYLTADKLAQCPVPLKGECKNGIMMTGIERYYIPEERAAALDKAVRNNEGALIVTIKNGSAAINDLLINGISWDDIPQEPKTAN